MKFRYDVNALRALAVTAVVLYHYKVSFVPGGFAGVDVFFVISGFLMTNIILGRLAKGKFSIWDFYCDRAKRIVPGLFGMCFVLLAAGYFVLEPAIYHYLGSTSIAALLFFSNFRFWEATGYFDPQSDTKWLLHTWSLSVEWQFYLAYPLLLAGLYRFERTRRRIATIVWGIALVSFVVCVGSSIAGPATAFYLLPARAWELLAGGIIALQLPSGVKRYSSALVAAGLLLIGISIAFYDKNMPWPYYFGLLPVAGTCLILAANRAEAAAFKNKIVQTIGLWSYSIYLWHWPVAVAAVYLSFVTTTPFKIAAEILTVAIILSAGAILLSLPGRLAEPSRAISGRRGLAWGAGAFGLTLALAGFVTAKQGLPNRRPDGEQQYGAYEAAASDWDYPALCSGRGQEGNLRPCRLGASGDRGTLFIGDSFTMQLYSRFKDYAKNHLNSSFTFLASPGCPPITGIQAVNDRFNCNGFVEQAMQFAEAHDFARIIFVSNWYGYFNPGGGWVCFETNAGCRVERNPQAFYPLLDAALASWGSRLRALRKRGAEIVIVGATPSGRWNVPLELAKRRFLGMDTSEIENIDRVKFEANAFPLKSRLMALAAAIGGRFVDPLDFLCHGNRCPTVDREGVPYFKDECHYRSAVVRTPQFQFMDDAAGLVNRISTAAVAGSGASKF